MKHFTLFLLLTTVTITATAQIQQGKFLIGGNISFESIKNEGSNVTDYKTTNFFFSPNIGYFIIEKLTGGIRLDIKSYKQSSPNDWRQTYTSISPFLRYYFLPSVKKINAFIDVGYLNYKTKFRNEASFTSVDRSNGYLISGGPAIFLTEQVALEFTVGYKRVIVQNGDYLSTTFNSGLGLQIHLGRKKIKTKN